MLQNVFWIKLDLKIAQSKPNRTAGKEYLVIDVLPTTSLLMFVNDANEFDFINIHNGKFVKMYEPKSNNVAANSDSAIKDMLLKYNERISYLEKKITELTNVSLKAKVK